MREGIKLALIPLLVYNQGMKTFLAAAILLLTSTAFASPSQEAQDRVESEAIGAVHRAHERRVRDEVARKDAEYAAYQAQLRAAKLEREEAEAKAQEEAKARAIEEQAAYEKGMAGPAGKVVRSALLCHAYSKHNEFLRYIREDNRYAHEAGVINLRQRADWKDELQHWDMVATLVKRDGGKATCRSKAVQCVLDEDCPSAHAWLFARAFEHYTMAAYQEVP